MTLNEEEELDLDDSILRWLRHDSPIEPFKMSDHFREESFKLIEYASAVLSLIARCPYSVQVNMVNEEKRLIKLIKAWEEEIEKGSWCI